ncbi:hypothetical protein ADM98_09520 [Exiguobacterium sp. BMC-KP]|uniref:hypothetical protein n=1 Tax=Exiguobacterium sp. BMC-KP TaxID=1684312 RepID=UPI0006AA3A73|nr:hypothetical protein [Exiguobacterium sp. BMC-KP]KOP29137.1 hypothetical protein ADM98_09520 [Exiguobacterium sp. BMC-KP]
MDDKTQKTLRMWLSIPRWMRTLVPVLISLLVVLGAIFKAVEMLIHPTSLSISLSDLVICFIPSLVLTVVIIKNTK